MKVPRTNSQKVKIQGEIYKLEAKKKTLIRSKPATGPASVKFYKELNKVNKEIEKLEAKL